jgi:hypothetical protein
MVRYLPRRSMPSPTKMWCPPARLTQGRARKLPREPRTALGVARSMLWGKRFACAIKITGSLFCGSRALCAAACRRIRITSPLHNPVRSDAA